MIIIDSCATPAIFRRQLIIFAQVGRAHRLLPALSFLAALAFSTLIAISMLQPFIVFDGHRSRGHFFSAVTQEPSIEKRAINADERTGGRCFMPQTALGHAGRPPLGLLLPADESCYGPRQVYRRSHIVR